MTKRIKHALIFMCFLQAVFMCEYSYGQTLSKYIVVDQFGYRPAAQKIAVLRDPALGFDAAESFTPGTSYALVNAATNASVFTASPMLWKNGQIDSLAGDKAWWFDFSSYTTPGTYYVKDVQKNLRSYTFEIREDIYNEVLRHSVRFFFYQRSGFSKQAPYADAAWTDGASHLKPLQDKNCRYYLTPNSAASEKDLHGGWYDAGDLNKYTNWTAGYIMSLLLAYDENPALWTDDFNIPESNNGIPDILDEAKWGMDYLLRLQNADGSVISLIGCASASPPSSATGQSLYGNVTTSSALKAAAAYAYGAMLYRRIGMPCYADSLQNAAVKSWNWAVANPSIVWQNSNTGVGVGNPEVDDYGRLMYKLQAAEMLFELTGNTQYRTFFDTNYSQAHLVQWYYALPYENEYQEILLYYTTIPNATASVVSTIKDRYQTGMSREANFGAYDNNICAYRSYLESYTWGSNCIKSLQGLMFHDVVQYNIPGNRNADALKAAEDYIHYIHGVNPLSLCYLTNMNNYGAEKSVTCMWHSWFSFDSPKWSKVGASTYGPAPGFLVGGANASYTVNSCCPNSCGGSNQKCTDPTALKAVGQPAMKSYADINDTWPLDSWSLSEPSCGYQVAYIRLLSKFVKANGSMPGQVATVCSANNVAPTVTVTVPASNSSFCLGTAITLTATAADADGTINKVEFYDGTTLLGTATVSPYTYSWTTAGAGAHTITAKATDNGGKSTTSAAVSITVYALPAAPTVTSPVAYCQNASAIALSASGTGLKWYGAAAGGTGTTTAPVPSTLVTGTTNQYVSQTLNGCESTRSLIAVAVNALPVITSYAQINGGAWSQQSASSVCVGSSINLGPQPTVSAGWTWTGPNGFASATREITLSALSATQAGNYTAVYTDANGCKSTSVYALTVTALPTALITAGGSTTLCSGGSVVLTASAGASYKWYNGTTQVGTAASYTATTAGSYTVEVTNANNCKATSAATVVTVNALPTALITANGVTAFCAGGSVVLTASSGASYKWYNGTTQVGTAASYTATAAGSYTVEVTNANNCKATSAATAVTVNALPTALITANGAIAFCAGGSVVLTASSGASYKWFNGTTQVGTAASYTATAAGSYTVEVTNANNCKATSAATTVTVNALPTALITAGGATAFCAGGSVVLTASAGASYKWYNGTTQVGTAASYTATTAGNYTVEVMNANNCKATSAATTVAVNALPTALITAGGPTAIPQGGTVVLAANTGSGLTYKWFNGTTQVGTASSYTATTAGVYTVEVSDATCTATSAGTTVSLNTNQPSVITIISPSANSTVQGPITIAATATDPDGAITRVEFLDGNTIIGTSTSAPYSFVWSNPGAGNHVITVRVTDSNGGITTSAPVNIISEAIATGLFLSNSNTLDGVLYPNPSNGIVFIDSDADLSGASFRLIDVMGNEYQLSQAGTGLEVQLNLSTISDGTYMLIITKDNSILRKKVTIIK